MEVRVQTFRGAIAIIGAIFFTMVALAATPQPETAECITRAQVREAVERSRNGISLTCNETVRQQNLRAMEAARAPQAY